MNIRNGGENSNDGSLEWDTLSKLLKHPIAFHRVFGKISGGALSGLFLSQAFYWTGIMQDLADERGEQWDGWFYKEQSDWEAETLMTRREQETARRDLKKRGLLEEKFGGLPRKLFYRLDRKAILKAIETETANNGGKRHYIKAQSDTTQRAKAPSNKGQKRQALIGTETTTENTQKQQQSVVEFSRENVETASIAAALQHHGVTAKRAKDLAGHPRAQLALAYIAAHPKEKAKKENVGGWVCSLITNEESAATAWAQTRANGAETATDAPKRAVPKKLPPRLEKAVKTVYEGLHPSAQKAADKTTLDLPTYFSRMHPDEWEAATK